MSLDDRFIHDISSYYAWLAKIDGAQPKIRCDRGQIDCRPPASLLAVTCSELENGEFGYLSIEGDLIEAAQADISKYRNLTLGPDQITPTVGAVGGLYVVLRSVAQPGDTVLMPSPIWPVIPAIAARCGLRLLPYPFATARDLDFLADRIGGLVAEHRPRAVVFNSPHNPTGLTLNASQIEEVQATLGPFEDTLVIWDEAYETFTPAGSDGRVLSGKLIVPERDFIITSMSKRYAAPSLRLGLTYAPESFAASVRTMSYLASGGVSRFLQLAGASFLLEGGELESGLVARIQTRRNAVRKHAPYLVGPSTAGLFICMSAGGGQSSRPICEAALKQGIGLMPGDLFGDPSLIRISLGASEEEILTALTFLEQYDLAPVA